MDRHDLTDAEWAVIQPLPPTKVRGVPRVDDRRVIHGIFWRFRAGTPWRDVPERYGPRTTLYNRFVRWRAAGIWDRILHAVSEPYDGDIVMIDSSRAQSEAPTQAESWSSRARTRFFTDRRRSSLQGWGARSPGRRGGPAASRPQNGFSALLVRHPTA